MRFSEFTESWKKKRFYEIADFYKGCGISKEQLTLEGNECILYGELYTTYDTETIDEVKSKTNIETKGLFFSKKNDVIIPASGETPIDIATACCVCKDNVLFGGDLNVIRLKYDNGSFISCQLNGKRKIDIAKIAQGASIVHLHNDDLKKLVLYIPTTLEEELKIVKLFTLIDSRIKTQIKIIEVLKSQKKWIYDAVFNKIDTEIIPLGSLCNIKKGEQINGSELNDNDIYPFMNGGTSPSGYFHMFNAHENTISISEGGNSCGYIQFNKNKFWCGGHCYSLINIKEQVNNKYLYHLLKANELNIMRLRVGSGLPNIQKKDLENFNVFIPSFKEQNVIASFLDICDLKINLEELLLIKLKEQKKYLLSNMFI